MSGAVWTTNDFAVPNELHQEGPGGIGPSGPFQFVLLPGDFLAINAFSNSNFHTNGARIWTSPAPLTRGPGQWHRCVYTLTFTPSGSGSANISVWVDGVEVLTNFSSLRAIGRDRLFPRLLPVSASRYRTMRSFDSQTRSAGSRALRAAWWHLRYRSASSSACDVLALPKRPAYPRDASASIVWQPKFCRELDHSVGIHRTIPQAPLQPTIFESG